MAYEFATCDEDLQFDTQFEQIECYIYGQLSIPGNIHKQGS